MFDCGDLVSLITFEWTILYQAVSCFSGKKLPLTFQKVMYLYFKNVRGKYEWKNERMNGKMKGNGLVAKLLYINMSGITHRKSLCLV